MEPVFGYGSSNNMKAETGHLFWEPKSGTKTGTTFSSFFCAAAESVGAASLDAATLCLTCIQVFANRCNHCAPRQFDLSGHSGSSILLFASENDLSHSCRLARVMRRVAQVTCIGRILRLLRHAGHKRQRPASALELTPEGQTLVLCFSNRKRSQIWVPEMAKFPTLCARLLKRSIEGYSKPY